jgi:hypothetical protein
MYKVACEVVPRQCQEMVDGQKDKAGQKLAKLSMIVDCAPRTWSLSRKKCRKCRLFALGRLHALNESPKSTLYTTNAILSCSMLSYTQEWTTVLYCCHAINMVLIHVLLVWLSMAANTCGQITAAPSCPVQADPWHSQVGLLVQKRGIETYCDTNSKCMSIVLSTFLLLSTYPHLVYCYQPAACVSGTDGYALFCFV